MTTQTASRADDFLLFFKTWLRAPLKTAAYGPSSRALADVAAREARIGPEGAVLEFGAGTGALTEALVDSGVSPDRLVLFESDPGFADVLRRRYPGARIIGGDCYAEIYDLEIEGAAAFVSGLPLVQYPDRAWFVTYCLASLGRPGARFVQLTYLPVSPVPMSRLPGVASGCSETVWQFPPARIWWYERDQSTQSSPISR